MILTLLFLNKRRKDFAYHGIKSRKILTIQNQIYCQNAVVQKEAWISTRLKTMYINDISIHEISIKKNNMFSGVVFFNVVEIVPGRFINIIKALK